MLNEILQNEVIFDEQCLPRIRFRSMAVRAPLHMGSYIRLFGESGFEIIV